MGQTVDELVDVMLRVEAQAMHARVEFDMYRPPRDTLLTGSTDEGVQQSERVYLGFEIIVEHGLEGSHLRVHDHDIGRDACLAEGDALICHGHGEIVDAMVL